MEGERGEREGGKEAGSTSSRRRKDECLRVWRALQREKGAP